MGVSPMRSKKRKLDGLWIRNGIWYYGYTHPITKKQVRKSAKTPNKVKAKQLLDMELGQAWDMKNLGSCVRWTVSDLINWAWDNHWCFKERTNEKHLKQMVSRPLSTFGQAIAAELPSSEIIQFIKVRDEEVERSTINRELAPLRSAYALAIRGGHLKANPLAAVPIFDESVFRRHRAATAIEESRITEAFDGVLRDIVALAFDSGLRALQIRDLKWADIDFTGLTMRTQSWKGRGERAHVYKVPIFPRALKVLLNQPRVCEYVFVNERGRQIPKNGCIHATFPRVIQRLGIEDFHFHDIRHTFGTNHYRRNRDILRISLILGHTKIETTKIYLNLTDEDLRQDMRPVSSAAERSLDTREAIGSIPIPGSLRPSDLAQI